MSKSGSGRVARRMAPAAWLVRAGVTAAGLVAWLLSQPPVAGSQDADADALPPGDGRAVVVAKCGLCHSVGYIAAPGKQSAEFWRETVEDMYAQAGWGRDPDQQIIIDYLRGAFGTEPPPAGGAPAAGAAAAPAPSAAAAPAPPARPAPAPVAQSGARTLMGTIVDQQDEPVRGARVTVTQMLGALSESLVATADFFRVELLGAGVYEVRVDAEGFAPWVGLADLRTIDTASLRVRLQPAGLAEPLQRYRPVTEAMALNPPPEDWLHFRRTYDHQAHSPLTQINRENVRELTLAWSWRVHPGAFEGTPQVHDGVMFVPNPNGGVQALDATTGDLLWEFQIPITEVKGTDSDEGDRSSEATPSRGILNAAGPSRPVRNLALWGDKVYTATTRYDGGRLVALDARTGKIVWERKTHISADGTAAIGDHSAGPIVVKGKVMLGTTNCERYTSRIPPCWIAAFDAETGEEAWRTSTIQLPGDPGPDTWGGVPALQRAGADNWQAGSYDPKTNLTYWGTAQAKPWVRFQRGHDGAALYSSSTLALDADAGKMAWYYQHIPGETFNMDETFERVLVDYDGKSSSFSMGKVGILWELDRRTGAFRAAHDLGYQDQGTVDPKTGQLMYAPARIAQPNTPIAFCPGVAGVKSAKAMAYHPETMAVYIPLFPHCQERTFIMPEYRPVEGDGGTGEGGASRDRFHPKSPEHLGDFVAQDIRTGKILWRHRTRTPPTTSAITTAGGLVVVADWDRYMRIYDVKDGKILYQTRLPSPGTGSPSTFMVDGRQYIAMPVGTGSGGNWETIPRTLAPEIRTQSWDEHLTGIFVFALPAERQ